MDIKSSEQAPFFTVSQTRTTRVSERGRRQEAEAGRVTPVPVNAAACWGISPQIRLVHRAQTADAL